MIIRSFVVSAVLALTFGCQAPSSSNEQFISMGPDVNADLVAFFTKETKAEEIFEFQRTVIGIPNKNGAGYSSLPGMMTVVGIYNNGLDGVAINFKPNASDEEKVFVKVRITGSPIVFRVYEDVVPSEISDLPNLGDTDRKGNTNGNPAAKPTREPSKIVITGDS